MNMTIKMMVAGVGMAAALSASAFSKSIAYSGVVRRADGQPFARAQNVPMTFRIYDSFKPDTVVWARTIPVRVETDGRFDVELSDSVGTLALPKGQARVDLDRACANVAGSVVIGQTMAGSNAEFRETLTPYPHVDRATFAKTTPTARLKKLQSETVAVEGNMQTRGDLTVPQGTEFGKNVTLNVGNKTVEVGGADQPITLKGGLIGWRTDTGATKPNDRSDRARLASLKREKEFTYGNSFDWDDKGKNFKQKPSIPFNVFTRPPDNGTAPVDVPAGATITGIQYF